MAEHDVANFIIREYLHNLFGHCFFVMDDGNVLQCRWPQGVEIRPLAKEKDFRHVDFTFDGIEKAIEHGKTLVGTKYDLKDILGIAFDSELHDPSRMICSRFIADCASAANNTLLNPAIPSWHVAPGDLLFSPQIQILTCGRKTSRSKTMLEITVDTSQFESSLEQIGELQTDIFSDARSATGFPYFYPVDLGRGPVVAKNAKALRFTLPDGRDDFSQERRPCGAAKYPPRFTCLNSMVPQSTPRRLRVVIPCADGLLRF